MRRPTPTQRSAETTAAAPESIEDEISRLTKIRADLFAQLVPLEQEKAEATARRRELLFSPGAGEDAKAEANRVCREREGDAFAVTDALEECDRRLGDAIARRDAAALAAERERVAAGLERNAAEIETAVEGLARAVEALARSQTRLAVTVGEAACPHFDIHGGIANPAEIANVLLLQALVAAMPNLGIHAETRPWDLYDFRKPVEPEDAVEAATAFGERLRETARRVRSGETSIDLPTHHLAEPDFTPTTTEAQVYVLAPFYFVNGRRERVMVTVGTASLPVEVVERATALGLASETPNEAWEKRQAGAGPLADPYAGLGGTQWSECADLGINLYEIRRAEAEQRRDAWLAERAPEAA